MGRLMSLMAILVNVDGTFPFTVHMQQRQLALWVENRVTEQVGTDRPMSACYMQPHGSFAMQRLLWMWARWA